MSRTPEQYLEAIKGQAFYQQSFPDGTLYLKGFTDAVKKKVRLLDEYDFNIEYINYLIQAQNGSYFANDQFKEACIEFSKLKPAFSNLDYLENIKNWIFEEKCREWVMGNSNRKRAIRSNILFHDYKEIIDVLSKDLPEVFISKMMMEKVYCIHLIYDKKSLFYLMKEDIVRDLIENGFFNKVINSFSKTSDGTQTIWPIGDRRLNIEEDIKSPLGRYILKSKMKDSFIEDSRD